MLPEVLMSPEHIEKRKEKMSKGNKTNIRKTTKKKKTEKSQNSKHIRNT